MAEIAVSVTIQVLIKASTLVADLIAKEGSRLFQLREEISWIETEMRCIQSYLKDAEHKRGQSEVAANFIRDVRNLAFDVEDTVEKYLPFPPKGKGFKGFLKTIPHIFSNYYDAHNFLAEIDVIKRKVQDLNRMRQTYGINEQHSDVKIEGSDERRSFPHLEEPNITGLEDHTRKLVAKICDVDPGLRVISITGMPGLGKTTLAKKVYNLVRTNFESSAWVYVSEQPVIKYILQDIARQVGLKIEKWEDGGEAILYEHLSQNRYVIVIDDIWQTSAWDAIKIAIPTNSENGSRIILTSRNRDVGVHVGCWSSLCELQPLGESDSKRLFEACLGPVQTIYDPSGLEEIGKEILRRCSGVPLAIVVISGLLKLRERSLSAWKGVLEQFDQGQDELSKKLALSYVDLPANLKPCFLYFGLFPEDHEIYTFDLINLWAAEGFIKGSRFREVEFEVEDVGEHYLNLLIARNLIQVVRKDRIGKVKSCRIHDILRSLCIHEAKEINFFTSSTDLSPYNCESIRRVTTHGMSLNDHISSTRRTPKLRSFLSFHEGWSKTDLCSDFFKDVNLVRVLLLSGNNFGPVSKEIWSLKNLTYLKLQGIHYAYRIEIPESIIILESLETLDFQDLSSTRFPVGGTELNFPMVIWNMKRLRHLLLPNPLDRVIPMHKGFNPNEISFQNFQTLVVDGDIFEADWLRKISEAKTLKITRSKGSCVKDSVFKIANLLLNSTIVLNKLETLQFRMPEKITVTKLNLFGYQNLSNLVLKNVAIGRCPQPDELPQNLTLIAMFDCVLNKDPLEVMIRLPKLTVLELINVSYALEKFVCTVEPGNFPQLEQLVICTSGFRKIIIEDGGMPRLKKLVTGGESVRVKLPTSLAEIGQEEIDPDFYERYLSSPWL